MEIAKIRKWSALLQALLSIFRLIRKLWSFGSIILQAKRLYGQSKGAIALILKIHYAWSMPKILTLSSLKLKDAPLISLLITVSPLVRLESIKIKYQCHLIFTVYRQDLLLMETLFLGLTTWEIEELAISPSMTPFTTLYSKIDSPTQPYQWATKRKVWRSSKHWTSNQLVIYFIMIMQWNQPNLM